MRIENFSTLDLPIPFVRFEDPDLDAPPFDGHYRLTVVLYLWREGENGEEELKFGTYAVETEFDVRNGEVVRD